MEITRKHDFNNNRECIMHPTAMKNANIFVSKYLTTDETLTVLDIGGANVNGTLRDIFVAKGHTYTSLDIREAEGVDIVANPQERYPIQDDTFNVVVSTSMMEHDQAFWITFNEMVRVVKPNGYIYLCVPSRGNHHWDRDCWRFLQDAYPALEKWNKQVILVEHYIDSHGHWGDNIGVFQKKDK